MQKAVSEMRFRDVEQASAALKASHSEIVPLEPASRPWTVGYARFAESTLWWGAMGAKSSVEGTLAREALIGFSLDANDYGVNRVRIGRDRAIFLPARTDYACAFRASGAYCFLSAPPEFIHGQAEKLVGGGFSLGNASRALDFGRNALRVHHAVSIARKFALARPAYFAQPHCRTSLQAGLLSAIFGALCVAPPRTDRRDPTLARELLAYLREHRAEVVYQIDLCNALGTSERSLRRIFPELFGCTPAQYLRMRRMRLARRALLSRQCTSVTEAAVRFGFFDLGRFAGTYRAVFGETPSASLKAVRR